MPRIKYSLITFFAVATCIIFLVFGLSERRRANQIVANAVFVVSPEYRAIVELDSQVLNQEILLRRSISQFNRNFPDSHESTDGLKVIPVGFRKEAANIRNSQLKLFREKMRLDFLKEELIGLIADSSKIQSAN